MLCDLVPGHLALGDKPPLSVGSGLLLLLLMGVVTHSLDLFPMWC